MTFCYCKQLEVHAMLSFCFKVFLFLQNTSLFLLKRIINLNLHKCCLVTPHSFFFLSCLLFYLFHRVVLSSPEMLKHPFSITLFGDWMYWTDWDRNAIFQADKFNGKHASLVANSSMVCIRPSTTRLVVLHICACYILDSRSAYHNGKSVVEF